MAELNITPSTRSTIPTDEMVSMSSAAIFAVGSMIFFWIAPLWNANYTPVRPWVWAIPGMLCLGYIIINVICIFASAKRTADIGGLDVGISLGNTIVLVLGVLGAWLYGKLSLGAFQQMAMWQFVVTAIAETAITYVGRVILSRRNIGLGSN
jgi:hypothetical protein